MDQQKAPTWTAPETRSDDSLDQEIAELSSSLILRLVDLDLGHLKGECQQELEEEEQDEEEEEEEEEEDREEGEEDMDNDENSRDREDDSFTPLDDQAPDHTGGSVENETGNGISMDELGAGAPQPDQSGVAVEGTGAETSKNGGQVCVAAGPLLPEKKTRSLELNLRRNVLHTIRDSLFCDPYIIETAESCGFPKDEWVTRDKGGRLIFYLKAGLFEDWLKRHSDSTGVKFTQRCKPYVYSTKVKDNSNQARRDKAGQIKRLYSCHCKSRKYDDKHRIKGGKTGKPRVRLPSIRCHCLSFINAIYRPKATSNGKPGDTYRIEYAFKHNHTLGGTERNGSSRLSQAIKQRAKTMFMQGISTSDVMERLTADHARLTRAIKGKDSGTLSKTDLVTSDDVYNILHAITAKEARKDEDDAISSRTWMEELEKSGYFTFWDKENDLYHGFSSPWQIEQLRKWGEVLCLDGIQHTCLRDTRLFTIVVKNKEIGVGIPVAFLLLKSQKWELLKQWLSRLKATIDPLCPEPYFPTAVITNQGPGEINATLEAFGFRTRVFYSAWHVLRAWGRQLTNKKLDMNKLPANQQKERRALIRKQLCDILYSRTEEEANLLIQDFRKEWQGIAPLLLQQLGSQYLDQEEDRRCWMFCYRQPVSYGHIHTLHYLESWLNTLGRCLLNDAHLQRLDSMIYSLVRTVVPHYQQLCIRHMIQVERMDPGRKKVFLSKSEALNHLERTQIYTPGELLILPSNNESVVKVRSFTLPDVVYDVKVDLNKRMVGQPHGCTCSDFVDTGVVCKHIALAMIELPNTDHRFTTSWDLQTPPQTIGLVEVDEAPSQPEEELESDLQSSAQMLDQFAQTINEYATMMDRARDMTNKEEVIASMKRTINLLQEHLPVQPAFGPSSKRPREWSEK